MDIKNCPTTSPKPQSAAPDLQTTLHQCDRCPATFRSAHLYEGHEEGNRRVVDRINVIPKSQKKLHECKYCGKTFPKKSILERHFLVHTKQKPFKCEICSKCFNQKSTLKTHILTHNSNNQNFRCTLCGLKFSQKINLRVHTLRMHPKRTASVADRLPCPYCPCLFKKLGSLNAHKTKVHAALLPDPTVEEPPVQSPLKEIPEASKVFAKSLEVCKMNVISNNLEPEVVQPVIASRTHSHLGGKSEDRQHACTICPAAFKKASHLTQHTRSHYGIKRNRCEICDKTFTTSHTLKVHRNSHSSTVPDFRCDQCSARFNLQSSLRRHAAIHENPDRCYSCPLCNRIFKWIQNCKTHIRNCHANEAKKLPVGSVVTAEQPAKLELQDESCIDLNNLPPNVQIYDINSLTNCLVRIDDHFYELPVQIDSDPLTQEQHIVEIVQEVSTEQQMYIVPDHGIIHEEVLDQCDTPEPHPAEPTPKPKDKKLPNVTEQDLFSETLVNGKKCYSCQQCQKPFKKPVDLRRHIRTHTGERPFKCDQCPKAFTLKAVLREHLKTHEESREVLLCTEPDCTGRFSSKAALELHRRIHTGDRPFRCSVCTLTFRTSGHMQAHMISHERLAAKREQNLLQFGA